MENQGRKMLKYARQDEEKMPTCGECKLLVPNPKEQGFKCMGKRCGATKVTPETDAGKCKKFERK
jgi:hypothetical protein